MKKNNNCNSVKELLAVLLIVLSSCTSDFYETPTSIEKLNSLKERIYRYAEEYGVNVTTSDSILIKNLYVSDEEIENRMRLLSQIRGTYIGCQNNKGEFNLKKLEKNITRSVSWSPEIWKGTTTGDLNVNSATKLSIELEYYNSDCEKSYVTCTSAIFHVSKFDDNLYPYEEDIDADVSEESYQFLGTKGFDYTAIMKCEDEYFTSSLSVKCLYEHEKLTCTIN